MRVNELLFFSGFNASDMETDDHTEAEVVADEFIQIIEEADLIHAERFIEDGFESNGEQEEQQGEELILAVNFEKVSIQEGQSEQEWQVKLTTLFLLNNIYIYI